MTINQGIKKCKQYAERYDMLAKKYGEYDGWFYEDKSDECRKECAEFWQIMGWLEELKKLKGE